MNRRTFILGSLAGAATAGTAAWFSIEKNQGHLTIDHALLKLEQIMMQSPTTQGAWNLFQIFTHCAQSVEYSMTGYPEHKSDLFKGTAGKVAFALFQSKGKMTHALDEVIPGAPAFSQNEDVTVAFDRFKQSLIDFKDYQGELRPHFAYGQLSKHEYEAAHVMHFNNHLQEISLSN